MTDEIELISDDDGLAVIGEPTAVEAWLRSAGQWTASTQLDLRRLGPLLGIGSDAARAVCEIAASSGRWVKLTEESTRLVEEHGLMESKTPGESHLLIGVPGVVRSWLQTEAGPGSVATNPAALSGVAAIMAQAAARQAMAEITDYLISIDEKVDDVLRKVDNTVVAQLVGLGVAIDRAMTIRDEVDEVDETLWSTVDQAHTTIGATRKYALDELDAIAQRLASTRIRQLARKANEAAPDVQRWLGVLARCSQLQEAVDVLEIERRLDRTPERLDAYRRGMRIGRQKQREVIAAHTGQLLDRMDVAVGTANAKLVWSRTNALAMVASSNQLAGDIHGFHELLGIEADPRSWEARELGPVGKVGAQAIQGTKDAAPYAGAVVGLGLAVAGKRAHGQGELR